MAYMQKNVNLLLMLLVVTFIFSLVLLTTLYRQNYKNLSEDYENASRTLDTISQNFTSKIEELQSTTSTLNLTSADKEKLDDLYVTLTADKAALDAELQVVRAELDRQKLVTELNRRRLSDATADVSQKERQIDTMRKNHKIEVEELKEMVCNLNIRRDATYQCRK